MRPSSSGSGPFRSSIWRRSTSPPQGRWLRNGSRASTRCERVRALACVIACVIACEMGAVLRSAVRGCAPSPLPEVARLERVYDVPLSEVALSATCVRYHLCTRPMAARTHTVPLSLGRSPPRRRVATHRGGGALPSDCGQSVAAAAAALLLRGRCGTAATACRHGASRHGAHCHDAEARVHAR